MKTYWIRTFATEDQDETVCGYAYSQFLDVCKSLDSRNIKYTTWVE